MGITQAFHSLYQRFWSLNNRQFCNKTDDWEWLTRDNEPSKASRPDIANFYWTICWTTKALLGVIVNMYNAQATTFRKYRKRKVTGIVRCIRLNFIGEIFSAHKLVR